MSEYNYASFDRTREEPAFRAFQSHLHVGARAPSFPLEELARGDRVELRSLWLRGLAVLEFGSFT